LVPGPQLALRPDQPTVASVLIPVDFRLFPPERQAKIGWRAFLENVDKAIWLLD
jgi:hypothetical protein